MKKLKITYLFWKLKKINHKISETSKHSRNNTEFKLAEFVRIRLHNERVDILKKLSELLRV